MGLAAFLADEPLGWDLNVSVAGYAWSLPAAPLRQRALANRALADVLLSVTHARQVEAALNVFCVAHHHALERLARLLLATQDRTATIDLAFTQERLSETLGLRRTTVTNASGDLAALGAIAQKRGVIRVLDRRVLQHHACSCYKVAHNALRLS